MRILTFLHSFEPGGVERDGLRLNAEWAQLGHDVRIILGRADGRLKAEAPPFDYHILQQGRVSTARFETLWMIWKLPAAIRELRPDILFCAGNTYTIVAVMMRLLLGRRCPPIVLKISNDLRRADMPLPVRWAYHLWLRLQAPFFAGIVAMADPAKAEIAEAMRVSPEKISVIPNPSLTRADLARFAAARDRGTPRGEGVRYLGIGRFVGQKNFALLLHAFARVSRPADRLTLVGDGVRRASLERLAQKLGIADRVTMPGYVNPVYSCFAEADVFVIPSDYEGLGVVVVEALAAGVPIVATDCCVNMSWLLEGAGRLVPPRDVAALADALVAARNDRPDPDVSRPRAEHFTVEATAPAWVDLFSAVKGSVASFTASEIVARATTGGPAGRQSGAGR